MSYARCSLRAWCLGLVMAWFTAFVVSGCASPGPVSRSPVDQPANDRAGSAHSESPAQERFRAGVAALHAGELGRAEQVFAELTRDYPQLPGPYVNLGILHFTSGALDEARQAFERALALDPDQSVAHNYLGVLSRRQGEFGRARRAYQEALRASPDYALAHLNLGILLDLYLNEPRAALEHYRRYQQLDGADPQVSRWIADLTRRVDKPARVAAGDRL